MKYRYVRTVVDYINNLVYLSTFSGAALDCETFVTKENKDKGYTALDCHASRISLMQLKGHQPLEIDSTDIDTPVSYNTDTLGNQSEIVILDILELERAGYNPQFLLDYLTSREMILGVYLQFDLKFIKKQFGIMLTNVVCVKTMSVLIGNATGSKFNKAVGNSFASLCRNFLNITITDKGKGNAQTTDWYTRPEWETASSYDLDYFNSKLDYAAIDVQYLFEIWVLLYGTLCKPLLCSPLITENCTSDINNCGLGMFQVYQLEMAAIPVFAEMEYNGMPINQTILEDIDIANKVKLTECTLKLATVLGMPVTINRWTGEEEVTPQIVSTLNSPLKLKTILSSLLNKDVKNTTSALIKRTINVLEKLYEYYDNPQQDEDTLDSIYKDDEEELFFSDFANNSQLIRIKEILSLIKQYKQISKQLSQSFGSSVNQTTHRLHCTFNPIGAFCGC